MEKIGELFDIPVIRVSKIRGNHAILDPCIWCGKTHRHGNGADWDHKEGDWEDLILFGAEPFSVPSHRSSHCPEVQSYYLIYNKHTEGLEPTTDGFKPTK